LFLGFEVEIGLQLVFEIRAALSELPPLHLNSPRPWAT
jgi:hypothetical protein